MEIIKRLVSVITFERLLLAMIAIGISYLVFQNAYEGPQKLEKIGRESVKLPDSVNSQLNLKGFFADGGKSLEVRAHNNSEYYITRVRVRISFGDTSRPNSYDVWGDLHPYSSGILSANTKGTFEEGEDNFVDILDIECKLITVYGYK